MFVATLWIAVFVVASLQIIYSHVFFRHVWRIPRNAAEIETDALAPGSPLSTVSVIICAHNEARNLSIHLPSVLAQDYRLPDGAPAFEVIVVDDGSTDETSLVLSGLAAHHPNLRLVHLLPGTVRTFPGKKFPLSKGLRLARYELVVVTDADCEPAGRYWLQSITRPFSRGKEIVAGYGGYRQTGSKLNAFVRYETLHTFLQYYSFTKAGLPFMAVGRNLAASKEIFLKAQQHPAWSKLPSGDDDLLVQLCANADNMDVITDPASFTWSAAKEHMAEYIAQKRRHVSTGKFYSLSSRLAIGGYALMLACWWLLLGLCLAAGMPAAAFFILLLPLFYHVVTLIRGARAMGERTQIGGWFVFFFCWMLYNAVLAPYILWKSKQRWK